MTPSSTRSGSMPAKSMPTSSMRAMTVQRFGGPDSFEARTLPSPEPGPGEVRLKQSAIGVNYVDLQHRAGAPYPMAPPFVPGIEAVGTVEAVGEGVDDALMGARMAYAGAMPGAYASHAVIAEELVFPVPDDLSDEAVAAITMQGMTAFYLTHDAYAVGSEDTVLVHAAAGGVGRLIVQWSKVSGAKAAGARVIGTCRRATQVAAIEAAGAEAVLVLDGPAALSEQGASYGPFTVIYDGLGGGYVGAGLPLLAARGAYVGYGLAAGLPDPINPAHLMGHFGRDLAGGDLATSLSVQWVNKGDFVATKADRYRVSEAVYAALREGVLTAPEVTALPLSQAADAHRRFEAGDVAGKLVLLP